MDVCQFIVSIVVAVVFSDVAAVITILIYQNRKAKKERRTALRSLTNEVDRIRGVVAHNRALDTSSNLQSIARMPVAAFETAFVSGTRGLDVGDELLAAVKVYLVWADATNSLVDAYPFVVAGHGTSGAIEPKVLAGQIVAVSGQELSTILDQLETRLREESQRV